MRRGWSRGALGLVLALVLTACVGGGEPEQVSTPRPGAETKGQLTVWGWDAAIKSLKVVDAGFRQAYPNITVSDRSEFIGEATGQIDQLVQFLTVLLVLSVLIAVLGIVNTLALSVLERTRELGLLRAVGMTRRQLRTAVRWESVLISLFGTLLGFGLGVAGAWGLTKALADEGVSSFVLPTGQLAVILGLAVLAGVLAAVGPARRAGRLNVLEAIATS